jgi:hypothetical protein
MLTGIIVLSDQGGRPPPHQRDAVAGTGSA